MYDDLSKDYDRFVNWPNRLALEIPFIESQIPSIKNYDRPIKILDAACGTGMHAIELAHRGYQVAGVDLSKGMIERAIANAESAGVQVRFCQAGFGELSKIYSNYDVLLCLGNSLPHVLNPLDLSETLLDFAACLKPKGILLIQNRNFDSVLEKHERWMEPQSYRAGDQEWIFLRFYDFDPDGLITFNMITLHRTSKSIWSQKLNSSRLYPLRRDELVTALQQSGFDQVSCYGGMDGTPFDLQISNNLVVLAKKDKS